jgi:multimeric flavodoxin WrbA
MQPGKGCETDKQPGAWSMKVLAINGSPNGEKGNTALILTQFLEGMKQAGAEVDLFYTKKMKINPCLGEYNCWFKTPGVCSQKDDMQELIPKLIQADILVFATPVYVDGMTGPLKNLLDRAIPIGDPVMEMRDGHCRHRAREKVTDGKLVLVSNCGFWEQDNFDPLVMHLQAVSRNLGREFAGALLRPHGPALKAMMQQGMPVNDVLEAAKEAGRQLVQDGRMKADTLKIVSRELLPQQTYVDIANRYAEGRLSASGNK